MNTNLPSPHRGRGLLKRLGMLLLITLAGSQLQAAPDFSMKGWATQGSGTTGGAGGEVVTVSTPEDLVAYLEKSGKYVIQVKGMIDLGSSFSGYKSSGRYYVESDKTIIGLGSDAGIRRGGFSLSGVNNVIIRNLTFREAIDDSIAVTYGSTHVWIDHNDFGAGPDGLVDVTRAADFVTISWNRFSSHDKTTLVGASDGATGDRGHLHVTYHNNWFVGTNQRHPRVRYGKVHVFNNYFDAVNVGIGIGVEAQIYSENNFFRSPNLAYHYYDTSSQPGYIRDSGSDFGSSGLPSLRSSGVSWKPADHYAYTLQNTSDVRNLVTTYSGVGIVDGTEPTEPPPGPVEPKDPVGLIAYYPLTEGTGTTARDQSGFGTPLDMTLSGGATWASGGGVSFNGGEARVQTGGNASKLAQQIKGTGQFSVEVWARPSHLNQPDTGSHPSRLVCFSQDGSYQNFMLGHGGEQYQGPDFSVRLRTTMTDNEENGRPNIVASGEISDAMSHYVVTFDGRTVRMYRDGELKHSEQRDAPITNWDSTYKLILGNETSGTRGWVGELKGVGIYDLALSDAAIYDRYMATRGDGGSIEAPIEVATYAEWLQVYCPDLSAADLDPTASPWGDGLPNLIRYALGIAPETTGKQPTHEVNVVSDPSTGDNYLTVQYNRRKSATDTSIHLEASNDGRNWIAVTGTVINAVTSGDVETVTVRDNVPVGGLNQRFVRIRVELISGV